MSTTTGPDAVTDGSKPHPKDSYTHGHHDSVLRSHRWRTAENSAAYLLPHLREGLSVLDVGCGPGTITVDLARTVGPGVVTGIDTSAAVLEQARATAADQGVRNVEFVEADVYDLPFADGSFDIVHAHQVLQHLSDPVAALREIRRVTRPGGLVAVRDADYAAMAWYPESQELTEWNELYHEVAAANGAQPDAGRRLVSWVRAAGFADEAITASAGVWCYASEADRAWWGDLWAERCLSSQFGQQARATGLADDVALEEIARGWRQWAQDDDGWFAITHGEVLARA